MAHWWVVVMGYYLLMFSFAFMFPGFGPFYLAAIFLIRIEHIGYVVVLLCILISCHTCLEK